MKIEIGEGIDWPAWIQAGGSLLALGVALFVAWLPLRRDRKRHDALSHRMLSEAVHSAGSVVGTLLAYRSLLAPRPNEMDIEAVREQADDVLREISDLPRGSFDNIEIPQRLALMRGHLRIGRNSVAVIAEAVDEGLAIDWPGVLADVDATIDRAIATANEIIDYANAGGCSFERFDRATNAAAPGEVATDG